MAKDLNQEDDSKAKLLFAKDQLMKYENTITELQRELGHTHQNHQNEIQRLQHACEVCHKDLNLVLFEKKEMDKTIAADKIKVAQIQADMIVLRNPNGSGSTNINADNSVKTDARTYVGGATYIAPPAPRTYPQLNYGLPNGIGPQ